MYLCFCMTLPDLFSLFFNSDPVSVCVVLYVIILIQIRIRYNVKNFITACTRLHDSDPQKWKISLPWEGGHPPPPPSQPSPRSVASLPRAWSLRSLAFWSEIRNHPPPPLLKTCLRPWLGVIIGYNYTPNLQTTLSWKLEIRKANLNEWQAFL